MSVQAAKQFVDRVSGDSSLQSELSSAAGDPAQLVEAGSRQGFVFTSDELRSVLDDEIAGKELDEAQLSAVAGGASLSLSFLLGRQIAKNRGVSEPKPEAPKVLL